MKPKKPLQVATIPVCGNTTNTQTNVIEKKVSQFTEQTISTFSTKIYSTDSARQNNINITCNTLNDTTVKKGETFSFCNTVRTIYV